MFAEKLFKSMFIWNGTFMRNVKSHKLQKKWHLLRSTSHNYTFLQAQRTMGTHATAPCDPASSPCMSRLFNLRKVLSLAGVAIVCSLRLDGDPTLLLVDIDWPEIVPRHGGSSSSSSRNGCRGCVPMLVSCLPQGLKMTYQWKLNSIQQSFQVKLNCSVLTLWTNQ